MICLACPIMGTLCLAAGFAANGWVIAVMAGASTGLAWWLAFQRAAYKWSAHKWAANKLPATLPPLAAFVISLAWSAVGLIVRAPAVLMILSTALALASWDLMLFDHMLSDNPISSTATIVLFQTRHYRSLALALGPGLLLVLVGRTIQLQISFVIIGLLVLIALFSIDRIWRVLKESGRQDQGSA
jgi:hypothetical protein